MISAKPETGFDTLVARLTMQARKLAAARSENATRSARKDPRRWRKASLLWPLFAKG